jgi:hypothetical protein
MKRIFIFIRYLYIGWNASAGTSTVEAPDGTMIGQLPGSNAEREIVARYNWFFHAIYGCFI